MKKKKQDMERFSARKATKEERSYAIESECRWDRGTIIFVLNV
jgi:hypothetical protein